MKKTILLFFFILSAYGRAKAQHATAEYLDINNVRARFMVHGDMFWDPSSTTAAYEFPKGSGLHSNFAASIWIGGKDSATNTVKVAGQTYRNLGIDYWPGPLDINNNASIDSITSAKWAQIWKVNKTTIDSFLLLPTHTLSNTHKSILEWPGRKNPHAKTPIGALLNVPDRPMAPFVDVNDDLIYNPLDGDYPDIKGEQMLWWIFNDKAFQKTASGSSAIGVEIHAAAYACTNMGLENTTFINLRVHNWGTPILDSTYIGFWNDGDVGEASDDYLGYDTAYNMAVYYNADNFDQNSTISNGYGSSLTQTGTLILGGPKVENPNYPSNSNDPYLVLPPSSFSFIANSNPIANFPMNKMEYYNFLCGKWRDGSEIVGGCSPTIPNSSTPYPFVYTDDPSVPTGVSERACNTSFGDRVSLISAGPFKWKAGSQPSDITFAIINTDTGSSNTNFNELRRLADSACKYADGCNNGYWPLGVPNHITSEDIKVYPNPSSDNVIIESKNGQIIHEVVLYSSLGKAIYSSAVNKAKTQLDIRRFAKGIYFLKVKEKNRTFYERLLFR